MTSSILSKPSFLSGEIKIPGDKSVSHRAILCSALAKSVSTVNNLQHSEDVLNTLNVVRQLGIKIEREETAYKIFGKGLKGCLVQKRIYILETLEQASDLPQEFLLGKVLTVN